MNIIVLGLSSDDVDEDLGHMQVLLGDAVEAAIVDASFDTEIQTLFFTPIVTRPGIGPFADKISYLRREPSINAATNISHAAWNQGDQRDRVNLMADALLKVVYQVKDTKFNARTKSQLRQVIEKARQAALGKVLL